MARVRTYIRRCLSSGLFPTLDGLLHNFYDLHEAHVRDSVSAIGGLSILRNGTLVADFDIYNSRGHIAQCNMFHAGRWLVHFDDDHAIKSVVHSATTGHIDHPAAYRFEKSARPLALVDWAHFLASGRGSHGD